VYRSNGSGHGHIVIRVEPSRARFWVLVLEDAAKSVRVTSVFEPYVSE
jgi:hypothetical protein